MNLGRNLSHHFLNQSWNRLSYQTIEQIIFSVRNNVDQHILLISWRLIANQIRKEIKEKNLNEFR